LRKCGSVDALCHFLGFTFHRRIVWSSLPEARVLPSGLNATEFTQFVCPLKVARSLPVAASHLNGTLAVTLRHGLLQAGRAYLLLGIVRPE
jgi:hypothetical protein